MTLSVYQNRYYAKTTRNAVKKLRETGTKKKQQLYYQK
jgi:hypothetical protein